MKADADPNFAMFKDFDFADAKPVAETPHLLRLQVLGGPKERITIRIDPDVLAVYRERARVLNGSYQTLMNDALRQFAMGLSLSEMVRSTLEEALANHFRPGG